jgi:hypothetical protein
MIIQNDKQNGKTYQKSKHTKNQNKEHNKDAKQVNTHCTVLRQIFAVFFCKNNLMNSKLTVKVTCMHP